MTFDAWWEEIKDIAYMEDVFTEKDTPKRAWDHQQQHIDKLEKDIDDLIELGTDQVVTEKIVRLESENKILIEALDDVYLNTLPERKANLETRMGVIAIDSKTALDKVRGSDE